MAAARGNPAHDPVGPATHGARRCCSGSTPARGPGAPSPRHAASARGTAAHPLRPGHRPEGGALSLPRRGGDDPQHQAGTNPLGAEYAPRVSEQSVDIVVHLTRKIRGESTGELLGRRRPPPAALLPRARLAVGPPLTPPLRPPGLLVRPVGSGRALRPGRLGTRRSGAGRQRYLGPAPAPGLARRPRPERRSPRRLRHPLRRSNRVAAEAEPYAAKGSVPDLLRRTHGALETDEEEEGPRRAWQAGLPPGHGRPGGSNGGKRGWNSDPLRFPTP